MNMYCITLSFLLCLPAPLQSCWGGGTQTTSTTTTSTESTTGNEYSEQVKKDTEAASSKTMQTNFNASWFKWALVNPNFTMGWQEWGDRYKDLYDNLTDPLAAQDPSNSELNLAMANIKMPGWWDDQCVLPLMIYGSEAWSLTMGLLRRLRVTQRAMKRAMLGVSIRDRIRNDEIHWRTLALYPTWCGGPHYGGLMRCFSTLYLKGPGSYEAGNTCAATGPGFSGMEDSVPPWANEPMNVGRPVECFELPYKGQCPSSSPKATNGTKTRYYYDPYGNQCKEFIYSGCGGTANNFKNQDVCMNTCISYSPTGCSVDSGIKHYSDRYYHDIMYPL